MTNLKTASLLLKTSDIPLNGSDVYGSSNQFRSSMTWNNINLRTVLGDMYDKYDIFNLEIIHIVAAVLVNESGSGGSITFGATPSDRCLLLQVSGLPFINQTYNFKNGCNTNLATICAFAFPGTLSNSSTLVNYNNTNSLTFGKNQDLCSITLSFNRVDDLPIVHTNPAPNMAFLFNIHGVTNEPNYNNDKRIF